MRHLAGTRSRFAKKVKQKANTKSNDLDENLQTWGAAEIIEVHLGESSAAPLSFVAFLLKRVLEDGVPS